MRRPFCLLGFGMLLGVFLGLFLPGYWVFLPLALGLLLFFASLVVKNERFHRLFPFFGAAVLGIFYLFLTMQNAVPLLRSQATDAPVAVSCTVIGKLPTSGAAKGYRVEVEQADGQTLTGFRQVAVYSNTALPLFKQLDARVQFFPSDSLWDSLLQTDGCCASAYLTKKEADCLKAAESTRSFAFDRWAERSRSAVKRALHKTVGPPYEGILLGAATGETDAIAPQELQAFRQAGIAHLFAVSGLHLSIVAGSFLLLLNKLRAPAPLSVLLTAPLILLVTVLAGFSPSVLRSAIMLTTALAALLFKKPYDPLNALGFTVCLLLLFRPVFAADAGFLLSLSASGGILLFAKPLEHRLFRFFKPKSSFGDALLSAFSVSLAAFFAVLPASLFFFNGLSLIAPLTNLPAGILAPFLVLSAHLTALLTLLGAPAPLLALSAFFARFFAFLMKRIGLLFAALPAGFYFENSWILQAVVLFFACLCAVLLYLRPSAKRAASLLTAAVLALSVCLCSTELINRQRDTVLLHCKDGGVQLLAVSKRRSALLVTTAEGSMRMPFGQVLQDRCVDHLSYLAVTRPTGKTIATLSNFSMQYPAEHLLADGILGIPAGQQHPMTDSHLVLSDRCTVELSDHAGDCAFALHMQNRSFLVLPAEADWASLQKKPGFSGPFDFCVLTGNLPETLPDLNCKTVYYLCKKTASPALPHGIKPIQEGQFTFELLGRFCRQHAETEPSAG